MTVKWTARPCSRRGRTAVKSSPRRVSGVLAGAAPAHLCRCPGGGGSRASSVSEPRGVLIPFGLQRPLLAWPVSGSHWAPHHRPGFLPPGRMEGLSRVSCLLLFYVDFGPGETVTSFPEVRLRPFLWLPPPSRQETGLVVQLLISEPHKALPSSGSLGNISIPRRKRKKGSISCSHAERLELDNWNLFLLQSLFPGT